ncbi:MAG: ATP-grasp domain-containing protein [Gammaproteobacteria bacterium]|nr:ATP-grasp domain-containing protein [Gammaproteobacteria bacterium]
MFGKILIANRGEIACRIARTAQRMGVATVMVYSDADAAALHVRGAPQAIRLGASPAAASYLDGAKVIAAALASGAQAVHPGYGFLSENADFAQACAAAGLTFIGPSVDAIRMMGSKSAAKKLMASHAVPLVPGYYGEDQNPALLAAAAVDMGFPVLIKASAGGGGRGMRVVRAAAEFAPALASAQRESLSAFADARVLLEKYIERPRHIEVQIFGDQHGNLVHLFERDCSLQRRHQKVIEEAPALNLTPAQRATLYAAATAAGRAVNYVGAGTVEFVVAPDGAIYFIEMNTRLQVEHPVTEAITGLDLVEWQLRVAAGEPLPLAQSAIGQRGHAIEVRVYAEDPAQDFRPSVGQIVHARLPAASAQVRVETGVASGDSVSPWYDAMVAKLIVQAENRPSALRLMAHTLRETELAGVNSNLVYLRRIIEHPDYAAGDFTTHFAEEQKAQLLPTPGAPPNRVLLLAVAAVLRGRDQAAMTASPWALADSFRLNHTRCERLSFRHGEALINLTLHQHRSGPRVGLPDSSQVELRAVPAPDGRFQLDIGAQQIHARVVQRGELLEIFDAGERWVLGLIDPLQRTDEDEIATGSLLAPMPGAITAVLVAVGDVVRRGQPLLVLEAMKIEHTITAPCDGTVSELYFLQGQQVTQEGAELVRVAPAIPPPAAAV